MPTPPRRRWPASPTSSGSPAASRRPAASPRSRASFPRIRKAYLIGEAAADFAADARRAGALRDRRHARSGGRARRPRCRGRRGLEQPVVLLSPACASFDQYPQFRGARRQVPRAGPALPGVVPAGSTSTCALQNRNRCLTAGQPWSALWTDRADRRRPPWFRAPNARPLRHWWWTVDRLMLAALIALMLGGIVLSLAASPPVAARLGLEPFYFVNRHILFLIPTLIVLLATSFLSPRNIRRLGAGRLPRQPRADRGDAVRSAPRSRARGAGSSSSASTSSRRNSSSPPSSS